MIKEQQESRVLFGMCSSIEDAEEFVVIKQLIDNWKCLVRPFPVELMTIAVAQKGTDALAFIKVPSRWGFVLHKFHS